MWPSPELYVQTCKLVSNRHLGDLRRISHRHAAKSPWEQPFVRSSSVFTHAREGAIPGDRKH